MVGVGAYCAALCTGDVMRDYSKHDIDPLTRTCRRCLRTEMELSQKFVSCMNDREIEICTRFAKQFLGDMLNGA
jgi:hypothetical protein